MANEKTIDSGKVARPSGADPVAWAQYNAFLLGLTSQEFENEMAGAEPPAAQYLARTVAVLTPSGELIASVNRAIERLDKQARQRGHLEHDVASQLRVALATFEVQS